MSVLWKALPASEVGLFSLIGLLLLFIIPVVLAVFIWCRLKAQHKQQG
ncbi:MAG: hypothetical protein ACOY3E_05260 [Pseudomonadota bacterium]